MIKWSKMYPVIVLIAVLISLIYFYFIFTSSEQELPKGLEFLSIVFKIIVVLVLGVGIYLWRKRY